MSAPRSLLLVAGLPGDGREGLGLGDLLRVLSVVPSLGEVQVDWCSPDWLLPLVAECPQIGRRLPPSALDQVVAGYDAVLNLSAARLGYDNVVDVLELAAGAVSLKMGTFDLPSLMGRHWGIELEASFPVAPGAALPDVDVGLNWRVPEAWAIKSLPEPLWARIEAGLGGVTCERQPVTDDLAAYVAWVRRCRALVSPVGLGCHLAMHYGVGLVMLAGPTDFAEGHDYRRGRVLFPPLPCPHRPCCRPDGVDGCGGCMHLHDVDAILAALRETLGSGQ